MVNSLQTLLYNYIKCLSFAILYNLLSLLKSPSVTINTITTHDPLPLLFITKPLGPTQLSVSWTILISAASYWRGCA